MNTRILRAWLALAAGLFAFALLTPTHATEQFANKGSSTLSAPITTTNGTSLSVVDASTFPLTGNFRLLIDSEYMIVTGVAGPTFTVTRGAESSTAATHLSGAAVRCILTAGALGQLATDTLSSAALSASGLYVPLAGNPAVLRTLALDPSVSGAYASQGVFRSYFSQSWFSRNSANTGETLVIGTNAGNSILIGSGSGTGASASVFITPTTSLQVQPATTTRFVVDTAGIALNATAGGYGGGAQVVFIGNRTTAPSSNPTGGGVLYAESGELLYRSSAGNTNQVTGLRYGAYASRPTVTVQGSQYFPTDGHTPWISDTSGAWHPLVGGLIVGTAPPLAASWTVVNQGASALVDTSGALKLTGVNDGATPQMHHYCVSATASVDATVVLQPPATLTTNTYSSGCVELRESSSSKFVAMCITVDHGIRVVGLEYQTWTASTTRASSTTYTAPIDANAPVFVRVIVSGSNILGQYSRNRIDWTTAATSVTTAVLTTAPNQACIGVMGFNVAPVVYIHHFASN